MVSELETLCIALRIRCEAHPYKVTLRKGNRRLTVPFFMGPTHSSEPTAADVLSCIVSDAHAGEDSFENSALTSDTTPTAERLKRRTRRVRNWPRAFGPFWAIALTRSRERSTDMKLYQTLAQTVGAYRRCVESKNLEWQQRHEERILAAVKECMPSGSGFDNGTTLGRIG